VQRYRIAAGARLDRIVIAVAATSSAGHQTHINSLESTESPRREKKARALSGATSIGVTGKK